MKKTKRDLEIELADLRGRMAEIERVNELLWGLVRASAPAPVPALPSVPGLPGDVTCRPIWRILLPEDGAPDYSLMPTTTCTSVIALAGRHVTEPELIPTPPHTSCQIDPGLTFAVGLHS